VDAWAVCTPPRQALGVAPAAAAGALLDAARECPAAAETAAALAALLPPLVQAVEPADARLVRPAACAQVGKAAR